MGENNINSILCCEVTGNPLGTDTITPNSPCPCNICQAFDEGQESSSATIRELLAVLKKYGQHGYGCAAIYAYRKPDTPCDCGLDDAIASLEPDEGRVESTSS